MAPTARVTVTFNGKEFKSDSYFRLSQGSNRVDLKIHTSCSKPLAVGDVFGPLTLVGFNGATGGTPVLYGYELKNLGDAVTVTSIVDDKLGDIDRRRLRLAVRVWPQARRCAAPRKARSPRPRPTRSR